MSETFHGYIETTQDSLLIFEASKRNILPKTTRRLQEKERQLVRSGSVFVFDEKESGIKRWTDGLNWSPSRILGNFLIYRELEEKQKANTRGDSSYHFKRNGLIKKTISVEIQGTTTLHLVSYYQAEDALNHQLRTPSIVPELANLEISPELLSTENFRIPPLIEL